MAKNTNADQDLNNSVLNKIWSFGMFSSSMTLYVLGVVSMDSSVNVYVVLGIAAVSITPVRTVIRAISALGELKEYERQKRLAAQLRGSMTEEEKLQYEKDKARASSELAMRQSSKVGNPSNA